MADIKVGARVKLYHTTDPYTKCRRGDMGIVIFINSLGTAHVRFDNGELLCLIKNIDSYEAVEETVKVKEN